MNTTLTQVIEFKKRARRDWRHAPFDEKMIALIRMQTMAREMASAAGRRFDGTVWQRPETHEARR